MGKSFDEAVGEEGARFRIEELFHIVFNDEIGVAKRLPYGIAKKPVFFAVGASVMVERNIETSEVPFVRLLHVGDQFHFASPFLASSNHDRGAMRVVSTNVDAPSSVQALIAHPDIGLNVLDQVAQMDLPVGVGQSGSHQEFGLGHESAFKGAKRESDPSGGGDCIRSRQNPKPIARSM